VNERLAKRIKQGGTYAILCLWSLVCIIPIYWVAIASFKNDTAIIHGPTYLPFVDFIPQLDAWQYILFNERERLLSQFFNSALIASVATGLAVFAGSLATYALSRFQFSGPFKTGNHTITYFLLASRILPTVAVIAPLYSVAERTGLQDTHLLMILLYATINLPVVLWLLLPIFGRKATEQEEAAWLEGESHFRIFTGILMPMYTRNLFAIAFLVFLLCWNEYFFAAYLAPDHAMTLPPWLVSQISVREAQIIAESDEITHLSAAIVLMITPLLLLASGVQHALKGISHR
jgi:multiple sugar transport system permease protein